MNHYTIAVGVYGTRKIFVKANTENEAYRAARIKLDNIADRNQTESPVAWDLAIVKVIPCKTTGKGNST